MDFFLGNLFSSVVGQRIESATSSSLQSEDWGLNMEICDLINSSEEGPRDAVRAIKKRIVGNKNFKEVMLTLTVLETCVKNCGHRFHVLVTTRDFIEGVLVGSIIPRNNPPLVLHDRVLSMVQAWADAFRSDPELTGVVSVYEDLRRKGLEFPMTELDGFSGARPPAQNLPGNSPSAASLPALLLSSKPLTSDLRAARQQGAAVSPTQVQQLRAELGAVHGNLCMMSDMMSRLDPVTVQQADKELLEQLYTVCKKMQERIVKVLPGVNEEQLIQELLQTNDHMNTTFSRYHRFERRLTKGQSSTPKSQSYVNLSDLRVDSGVASATSDSLSSHFTKLSTSESDETLSRVNITSQHTPSEKSEVVGSTPGIKLLNPGCDDSPASTRSSSPKLDWMIKRGMIPVSQANVMDDIEKWLELEDEYEELEESEGVTSEEFDRFLAERAKVAERLPSVRASSQEEEGEEPTSES